jgi:hypothetical protein
VSDATLLFHVDPFLFALNFYFLGASLSFFISY